MKPYFSFCAFVLTGLICALSLSCNKNTGNEPGDELRDNSFSYCGSVSDIRSALCESGADGSVTFYFSPSDGISDLEEMIAADDFIKISTKLMPQGEIDLLEEGNTLTYKDITASKEHSQEISESYLSLKFSQQNAELETSVETVSGKTLRAKYSGKCPMADAQKPSYSLNQQIFGVYTGQSNPKSSNNYRLAFTNAQWEGQNTDFTLTSEGYALVVSLYGENSQQWKDIPTGDISPATSSAPGTYSDKNSYVLWRNAAGESIKLALSGNIAISQLADGIRIEATFTDAQGKVSDIVYEGACAISNGTFKPHLPQIGHDVNIDGGLASAVYQGDVFGNGSGVMEITIIDKDGANDKPNSYAVNLALFSTKFNNPKKDRRLIPGTYTVTTDGEQGTWMPTQEMEFMGMVIPLGTYAAYDDGSQSGKYLYACDGTITIEAGERNYFTITFDLSSPDGYTIKGSFTGDVPIEDRSDDQENDGSSTLESDLEMELSYLPKAYLYPQSSIYVGGLGTIPVSEACDRSGTRYGYQFVDIGLVTGYYVPDEAFPKEGRLVEGDILRLEFLVNEGKESSITPGTYTITPNRYPAQFKAGVCPRGYQSADGNLGSRWQFIANAIGNADIDGDGDVETDVPLNIPSVKGFACLYEGTVTVTKSDKGDNWFTFDINAQDVLKHNITGQWTGPVYFAGSDTPVTESGDEFKSPSIERFSQFRRISEVIPFM